MIGSNKRLLLFLVLVAGIQSSLLLTPAFAKQPAKIHAKAKVVCFGDSITKRSYRPLAWEPEWLSKDGVHPSEVGDAIIAKAVAPLVANPGIAKQPDDEQHEAEIIIYNATSAGVVAAVQAARMRISRFCCWSRMTTLAG